MADRRAGLGPLWRRLTQPVRYLALCFVEGDREWGDYRLTAIWALILALAVVGRFAEDIDRNAMLEQVRQVNQFPVVGWVTSLLPSEPLAFFYAFFTRAALRYWVPPLFGAALAFTAGALYLQDIFELKQFWREAVVYLYGSLFAQAYPLISVRDGQIAPEAGETNWLDLIGGPGYVDVKLGNAILCERIAGPSSVYGAGRHFLRRFETVREVVSLEEQHRRIDEFPAVTKDGIPVTIRDLEVTFRVHAGHPRSPDNPYPFLPNAIRRIAYGQTVSDKGVGDWQSAAVGAVRGRLSGWIAAQNLDAITAPLPAPDGDGERDPRRDLRALFETPEARKKFAEMGVELLWVSIGHIDSPPEVDAQRLANWRAFWEGNNSVSRAHADAAYIMARAELQSETLRLITRVLQNASMGAQPGSAPLSDLILLNVAQIVESLAAPAGLVDELPQLEGGPAATSNPQP